MSIFVYYNDGHCEDGNIGLARFDYREEADEMMI